MSPDIVMNVMYVDLIPSENLKRAISRMMFKRTGRISNLMFNLKNQITGRLTTTKRVQVGYSVAAIGNHSR